MPWGKSIHHHLDPDRRHGLRRLRRPAVEHQGNGCAGVRREKAKDDPFAKIRIAEAASDIDAAWRQLIGNVADSTPS